MMLTQVVTLKLFEENENYLGERNMGELYQFKCLECELEFKLGREREVGTEIDSMKILNERSKEISSQDKFVFSIKQSLVITSNSPVEETVYIENQDGEIKVKCPRCYSDQTLIFRLEDWIVDYQVW